MGQSSELSLVTVLYNSGATTVSNSCTNRCSGLKEMFVPCAYDCETGFYEQGVSALYYCIILLYYITVVYYCGII